MNIKSDILIGLQHGDEGKGKITAHLIKNNNYTLCVRYNGGPNAGHTIYIDNKKYVTHQLPTGILFGVPSLIGNGCIVDLDKLKKEIEETGADPSLLKISKNAHIINTNHIDEDIKTDRVGSTKCGIRPCFRDKFNRTGTRINDLCTEPSKKHGTIRLQDSNICHGYYLNIKIVDPYKILNQSNMKILFEGAQGFELDIDWGDYPYVTSSNCTTGFALTSGVNPHSLNKVYGIAKLYETYVGNKKFQSEDPIFNELATLGHEFGSTTGRPRQCNWLDIARLRKAIIINGVTNLIINKCDIIKELGVFKLFNKDIISFDNLDLMIEYIFNYLSDLNINMRFSYSKDTL